MLGHPSLLALGIFDNTMAGFGGHCELDGGGGGWLAFLGLFLTMGMSYHNILQVFHVIDGCLWLGKNFAQWRALFINGLSFICVQLCDAFLASMQTILSATGPSLNPTPALFLFPFLFSCYLLGSLFSLHYSLPVCPSCFFGVGVVQFNGVPPLCDPLTIGLSG